MAVLWIGRMMVRIMQMLLIIRIAYSLTWQDGFYLNATYWAKWDDSWKTWANASECLSWESYMYYDSGTGKWSFWAEGQYYDFSYQTWRNWDGKWRGNCLGQKSWFTWASPQILDLEAVTCVTNCDTSKMIIESPQYLVGKVWRSLEYYVNPQSSEMVEIGTITYPYRSFRAVASEILNNFSHQNVSITIYF